jgi:hypothetical protein
MPGARLVCVAPVAPLLHAKVAAAEADAVAAPSAPPQPDCWVCVAEAVKLLTIGIFIEIIAKHPLVVEVAVMVKLPEAKLFLTLPVPPSDHTNVAGWLVVSVAAPFGAAQVAPKILLEVVVKLVCWPIVTVAIAVHPPETDVAVIV